MYRRYSTQEHLFIWSNKEASSLQVSFTTRVTTFYLSHMRSIINILNFRGKKLDQNSSDFWQLSYYQIHPLTNYDVFRSLKNALTGKKTVSNGDWINQFVRNAITPVSVKFHSKFIEQLPDTRKLFISNKNEKYLTPTSILNFCKNRIRLKRCPVVISVQPW